MPSGPVNGFPFTAVVGMDDAKRALECALVNDNIRTVLLRGGTGTAKTVLARAAAGITKRRIVNCPLNATEEQIFGGLDFETAVKTGESKIEKGLLYRADGNILFIDDVNLMETGILAGILDSVMTGIVRVERGPISETYPCNTILIATMNPADSDLSEHMLDRFDLVAYSPPAEEDDRKRILERNIRYSLDPEEIISEFSDEEQKESTKIERAVKILPLVTISDELVSVICELCIKVGADGLRGDLAMINCSKSLAALNGRDEVMKKDVEEAAVLCLPHRRKYDMPPPETPPEPPQEQEEDEQEPPEDQQPPEQPPDQEQQQEQDDDTEDNNETPPEVPPLPDIEDMMFEIGRQFRIIDYLDSNERLPSRTKTRKGRRTMAESADGTGRYARFRMPAGRTHDIAFDATLRAAAPYQRSRHGDLAVSIEKQDIREKVRERRSGSTILFLVDASGSLGVRKRMATVKGAILSMLRDSYVKRDRVGLMAFRREGAELILPPTKSVEYSYNRLEELPTGGKTPLGKAMETVHDFMTSYSRTHIGERCYIVLITDGRANVPLTEGANANEEVQKLAEDMQIPGVKWIVVDAGMGFPHFDNAERLAEKLEARFFRLEDLDADRFAEGIKAAID